MAIGAQRWGAVTSNQNGVAMDVQRSGTTTRGTTSGPKKARRLRRLQVMMSMVMSVLSQDPDLTLEEAAEMPRMPAGALNMFPGKELAYDADLPPRLQRLMNERFRLQ